MPCKAQSWTTRFLLLQLLLLCLLPACAIRGKVHPMVEVSTKQGTELGVSTTDGILTLGTKAREGRVLVLMNYGDIPYQESATIQPAGGGFYRLDMDVRHRGVLIANRWPDTDESLLLMGSRDGRTWSSSTSLARVEGLSGEVYYLPGGVELDPSQAGAGIFRQERGGQLTLVGMVKGTLKVDGTTYLAAAGLEDLRRCLETRRRLMPKQKVIHRPDLSRPIIKE